MSGLYSALPQDDMEESQEDGNRKTSGGFETAGSATHVSLREDEAGGGEVVVGRINLSESDVSARGIRGGGRGGGGILLLYCFAHTHGVEQTHKTQDRQSYLNDFSLGLFPAGTLAGGRPESRTGRRDICS